jgi:hypothetical protein
MAQSNKKTKKLLLVGGLGVLALMYQDEILKYLDTIPGLGTDSGKTPAITGSGTGGATAPTTPATPPTPPATDPNKPKPPPPSNRPDWMQSNEFEIVDTVNTFVKDLAMDLVAAKVTSAALNESGLRKTVAQERARKAQQAKVDAASSKLAKLEAAKANLEAKKGQMKSSAQYKENLKLDYKISLGKQELEKQSGKQETKKWAALYAQSDASEKARNKIKVEGDKVLAKQALKQQQKLASKSSMKKPIMGLFVKKVSNSFAKGINNTRSYMAKAKAAIKLPKFTTRTAVHTSAGLFGLVFMAYDLVRTFEPKADPFYKPNDPNQVQTVPVDIIAPMESYNLPLCDDAVNNGTATPDNPVLCRENKPKPWEQVGNLGLGYMSECPPNYQKWYGWSSSSDGSFTAANSGGQSVPYSRCVLAVGRRSASDFAGELTGLFVDTNVPGGRGHYTGYAGHSVLERTSMTRWDATPEKTFVDLGLRAFANDMANQSGGKKAGSVGTNNAWATEWSPLVKNSGKAEDGITVPSGALTDGVDYNPNNPKSDPDFQWFQTGLPDEILKKGGGEFPRIPVKYLGDFAIPYTDVGVTWRGGQALSDKERMKKLFPDMTDMEYDSSITNANADNIAT